MWIAGGVTFFLSGRCVLCYLHQEVIMDILREYQKTHPEEYEGIRRLKENSDRIRDNRKAIARTKLAKIEECRRRLHEKH